MTQNLYHAVVFGATSTIATEALRALVAERPARLLLVGRHAGRIERAAADLRARGAECDTWATDLLDAATDWRAGLDERAGGRPWDLCLLAHGSLPDQQESIDGPAIAEAVGVNFTSHAVIANACAAMLEEQGQGTLAVVGSVAGDRGRQSNYVYGSAKAGMATFMAGLRHRFAGRSGVRIVLLKPGMTDTAMTVGMPKGPLFSSAEKVGRLAWKAIRNGKAVAYLPGWWRCMMFAIRKLPAPLFHRTRL